MWKKTERIPSGCAISGFINRRGRLQDGEAIIRSIAVMHDRSNGLGGGFAVYGCYPAYCELYAFHLMYESEAAREQVEEFLRRGFVLHGAEPIPTRPVAAITEQPLLWRYFLEVKPESLIAGNTYLTEEDFVVAAVMEINARFDGAYVASSGKNMGVFKGVGYPEDIGRFYRLEEYQGYLWTAHGRFPTNTPGWWGGAHPFALLDWSVVHNGELSSYGINKRYLESHGYLCRLGTDTEVIAYLVDLLQRRHGLPLAAACLALTAPFWSEVDHLPPSEAEAVRAIRLVYGSALLNGPFSLIVANRSGMIGLNDRIKLRPMVVAERGETVYMASEEAAVREISPTVDRLWYARGGEPVVAALEPERQPEVAVA
ncbi:MAG TPA: glutamine amidotransferase family protein [Firmicutes bacterium]|nr:glutamine amidotransferase family protein [Bacillota bacterium]